MAHIHMAMYSYEWVNIRRLKWRVYTNNEQNLLSPESEFLLHLYAETGNTQNDPKILKTKRTYHIPLSSFFTTSFWLIGSNLALNQKLLTMSMQNWCSVVCECCFYSDCRANLLICAPLIFFCSCGSALKVLNKKNIDGKSCKCSLFSQLKTTQLQSPQKGGSNIKRVQG